jgi:hypothetical protein
MQQRGEIPKRRLASKKTILGEIVTKTKANSEEHSIADFGGNIKYQYLNAKKTRIPNLEFLEIRN